MHHSLAAPFFLLLVLLLLLSYPWSSSLLLVRSLVLSCIVYNVMASPTSNSLFQCVLGVLTVIRLKSLCGGEVVGQFEQICTNKITRKEMQIGYCGIILVRGR